MLDTLGVKTSTGAVCGVSSGQYIGLNTDHPALFGNYLKQHIFDRVPFKEVYYIGTSTVEDSERRCEEYGELLKKYPRIDFPRHRREWAYGV